MAGQHYPAFTAARDGAIAALGSALTNASIFGAFWALGQFPEHVVIAASGRGVTVGAVLFASAVPALIGGAIAWAAAKRSERPGRWLAGAIGFGLVVTAPGPFALDGAPIGQLVALELMHVVTAAVTWWAIMMRGGLARRKETSDDR